MPECPSFAGILVLPRLRVQNANAVSSPLTWGFPSMTAFLGLMWALERKVFPLCGLEFQAVGVVCHAFEPQVTSDGFTHAFRLKRVPVVTKDELRKFEDGSLPSIVEEGRTHLDVSLVFAVTEAALAVSKEELDHKASVAFDAVQAMRVAGGSVLPQQRPRRPRLFALASDEEKRAAQFRALRSSLLPGFALVSRHDLLLAGTAAMQAEMPEATMLDAWLDMSRLNWRAEAPKEDGGEVRWRHSREQGWIVPIPVGYGSLSPLYPAGTAARARDAATPFRFVESLYSLGQWLGPHRLANVRQMLWYAEYNETNGTYLCRNDFTPIAQ
jgi:CRISPR-associated protein Csy2